MNDYTPFMDLHPELKLIPTTRVRIGISDFQSRFDYVQDFNRKERDRKDNFHLIVKNGKYGVLLHDPGVLGDVDSIALNGEYDSIEFVYKAYRSFCAIVKKDEKYGLVFWTYGRWRDKVYIVTPEYDSMILLGNGRFKGIKDDSVVYFDETGHILK